MSHFLHTSLVQKSALLADKSNSAYYQSSGEHLTRTMKREREFVYFPIVYLPLVTKQTP